MSAPRARPGIRKKASLRLGRKTAQFSVGEDQELFTIHEDLVCVSPFFRGILQPRRKAIEGDCSICHEELDPSTKELTYCAVSCGGNFHRSCIEKWMAPQRVVAKCPLCRQRWDLDAASPSVIHRLPALRSDVFEIFFEWSYRTHVPVDKHDDHSVGMLIIAYMLGVKFKNDKFCEDVLGAFLRSYIEGGWLPTYEQVKSAYANTTDSCHLRTFLVAFHVHLPKKYLEVCLADWNKYPAAFLRELTIALAARRGKKVVPWEVNAMEAVLISKKSASDEDGESDQKDDSDQDDDSDQKDDDDSSDQYDPVETESEDE